MKKEYTTPEWARVNFEAISDICEVSLPAVDVDPGEDNEEEEF